MEELQGLLQHIWRHLLSNFVYNVEIQGDKKEFHMFENS